MLENNVQVNVPIFELDGELLWKQKIGIVPESETTKQFKILYGDFVKHGTLHEWLGSHSTILKKSAEKMNCFQKAAFLVLLK